MDNEGAKNLTIRKLEELATVLEHDACSNGLGRLAGTWTEVEHEEFVSAIANFEQLDQEFWT
jgi:hypothetical protein